MGKKLDLNGKKFNRLLVLSEVTDRADSNVRWNCLCDCGNQTTVTGSRLKEGITKSCGCLVTETLTKHGYSKSPEYTAWADAKNRCNSPKHSQWDYYGGRGITMQKSWEDDFVNFIEYIGLRPSSMHSLDRVNNNLGYCEGNVRWATKKEQVSNRGRNKNNKSGVNGVHIVYNTETCVTHYKATYTIDGKTKTRSFSAAKHGDELAKELAKKVIDNVYPELVLDGYTEEHGLPRTHKEEKAQ